MSFVQDNSNSAAVASATTIQVTLSGTVAGNLLRVVTAYANAGLTNFNVTVSDGTNTWSQALHFYDSGNSGMNIAEWYAPNIAGGSVTVTATFAAATAFQFIYVQERSNISHTSALNVAGTGASAVPGTSSANAIVVNSITTTGGGTTDVCAFAMDVNGTATINAGNTLAWVGRTGHKWTVQGGSGSMGSEDLSAQAAGAYVATFGQGGGDRYISFATAYNNIIPLPLIGQTVPTSGGSGGSPNTSNAYTSSSGPMRCYAPGVVTQLNMYVTSVNTATTLYLGLYDISGNLLCGGQTAIAAGLNTVSINNGPHLTYGQSYWLVFQVDGSMTPADDGSTFHRQQIANSTLPLPATLAFPGSNINAGNESMWAAGTLDTGAAGTPLGGPPRTQWHWRS